MKSLLLILAMFFSISASSNTRRQCENAYYATGYTKLHQYSIIVNWARVSDQLLIEIEDIFYGDYYQVLEEKELENSRTKYKIKESNKLDPMTYEGLLRKLEKLTGNKATCVYDI